MRYKQLSKSGTKRRTARRGQRQDDTTTSSLFVGSRTSGERASGTTWVRVERSRCGWQHATSFGNRQPAHLHNRNAHSTSANKLEAEERARSVGVRGRSRAQEQHSDRVDTQKRAQGGRTNGREGTQLFALGRHRQRHRDRALVD